MRIRAAAVGVALLAGLAAGCSQSYDEIANDCYEALKSRTEGDTAKPEACKDIKSKDYTALVMGLVLDREGIVDEDGHVDMGKLLEGADN